MGLVQKRLRKAKLIASILVIVPFVRMIALTGSLARCQSNKNSDIDFFIVTKAGRIWTCRFFLVFLLKILGQYRTEGKSAGRICPNRYQAENSLEIYPRSIYHAKEYSQIVPLFDKGGVYREFQKSNQWMVKKLKNQIAKSKIGRQDLKLKNNFLFGLLQEFSERLLFGRFGDLLEEKLKNYQTKRILWDKRTYQKKARIIISDQKLCFHPKAR